MYIPFLFFNYSRPFQQILVDELDFLIESSKHKEVPKMVLEYL